MTNTTIQEQQQKLAVDTAVRIQKYLSRVWTADSQEGAVETAKEVSTKIGAYLTSMHTGQSKMTAELKEEADKLIITLCDDEQKAKVTAEVKEAVDAINSLHNTSAAVEKSEKAAEKERQAAEKAAAREKAKVKKESDKKAADEAKKQRQLAAKAAQKALQNFKKEDYNLIKFEEMEKGDFISFDNIEGYTDVYPVYDLSRESLYVIEGYSSAFKPDIISVDLDQFHVLTEGKIVFIDEYDNSNQASIACYRKP